MKMMMRALLLFLFLFSGIFLYGDLRKSVQSRLKKGDPKDILFSSIHHPAFDLKILKLIMSKLENFDVQSEQRRRTILHYLVTHLPRDYSSGRKRGTTQYKLNMRGVRERIAMIKYCLANKADLTIVDYRGRPILYEACNSGSVDIVKVLIEAGADKFVLNRQKNTILHAAVVSGNIDLVKYLLSIGLDLNAANMNGMKPVHMAVSVHSEKFELSVAMLKFLLSQKVDMEDTDRYGRNLHHVAAAHANIPAIEYLLKLGKPLPDMADKNGETPLFVAASRGNFETFEVLRGTKADCNARQKNTGYTPLMIALLNESHAANATGIFRPENLQHLSGAYQKKYKEIITVLLKSIKDVNDADLEGNTLLHFAAMNGNEDVVRALIRRNVDVNIRNKKGETPVMLAARYGKEGVLRLLSAKGADTDVADDSGITMLHKAAMSGNEDMLKRLATKKMDINVRDKNGNTPLMLGVNQIKTVEFFIKHNADLTLVNNQNQTLLHCAATRGNPKTIQLLLNEHKFDLNARDKNGNTPLMAAAYSGNPSSVRVLINAGADVSIADNNKRNLFMAAVLCDSIDLMKQLKSSGKFQINAVDSMGFSALVLAVRAQKMQIVKYLLNSGANPVCQVGPQKYDIFHFVAENKAMSDLLADAIGKRSFEKMSAPAPAPAATPAAAPPPPQKKPSVQKPEQPEKPAKIIDDAFRGDQW